MTETAREASRKAIADHTASCYEHLAEAEGYEREYQRQLEDFRESVADFDAFLEGLKSEHSLQQMHEAYEIAHGRSQA